MSVFVSCCFLLDAFLESLGDVDACLVGDAAEYPEDVGNLFLSPYLRAMTRASSPTSSVRTVMLVSSEKYLTP